ncbi:MAG: GEVED domain-containing protein [Caldilineales bacterium]|nr:GEVED domain-containing protein [Caldilineales bacterium]MDW8319053.1 GEVED domain-containing protein [Anaerolineae bacterium]
MNQSKRRRLLVAVLVLALVLALAPVALATWTTINTNNGVVDTTWGSPDYSDTCTFTSRQVDEIKDAWVRWDGDNLYFRIDTCAAPPLTPKAPGPSSPAMRAIAAIDCNNDGDFTDGDTTSPPNGDRLVVYFDEGGSSPPNPGMVHVVSGTGAPLGIAFDNTYSEKVPTSSPTSIEWRVPAGAIYAACRPTTAPRNIRFATVEVGATSTTIDQTTANIQWFNPIDYGDLNNPDPATNTCTGYPTRLPCDGARHGVVAGAAILGSTVDPDQGNLHGPTALADDLTNTGSADDEDGVAGTRGFVWTTGAGGGSLTFSITGGSGYLNCWIDWNGFNAFGDAGEQVITNEAVSPGTYSLSFNVPVSPLNLFYARCRVSPSTGAGVTGPIYGGEVEDHRLLPQTSALSISKPNASDVQLSWSDLSASDSYNLYRSPNPYFNLGDAGVTLLTGSPFADPPVTDAGVLGNASDDNYFYVMTKRRVADSTTYESAPSNTVGLFEFALVPGTP